ncbi:TetR/AcrR family transcriptional regulator [Streptomyces sp. CA-249302]|uniref:TetR/AcrR family transcriptional regulator n=1 Tax=Streptomyces sp. CA-249302 TaxID=3240058 RepID=UPI003D8C843F
MTTSASSRPRGPYARTAERRRSIARAVLDIVVEKGYGNVTTAEVAQRVGSSEATVLYHYPSKDHLLVAALEHSDTEDSEQRLSGDVPSDFSLEELRGFARTTPRRESIMRLYSALAGEATTPGHPAQEYFAQRYNTTVTWFAALVERRQAAGLAHPGLDSVETGRQIVATWDGLQTQWLVDPSFDLGDLLVSAFRRLSGQNWMEARNRILDPETGL